MVGLVSALSSKALNGHSFFNGTVCVAKDELTQLFICKLPNFFWKSGIARRQNSPLIWLFVFLRVRFTWLLILHAFKLPNWDSLSNFSVFYVIYLGWGRIAPGYVVALVAMLNNLMLSEHSEHVSPNSWFFKHYICFMCLPDVSLLLHHCPVNSLHIFVVTCYYRRSFHLEGPWRRNTSLVR